MEIPTAHAPFSTLASSLLQTCLLGTKPKPFLAFCRGRAIQTDNMRQCVPRLQSFEYVTLKFKSHLALWHLWTLSLQPFYLLQLKEASLPISFDPLHNKSELMQAKEARKNQKLISSILTYSLQGTQLAWSPSLLQAAKTSVDKML